MSETELNAMFERGKALINEGRRKPLEIPEPLQRFASKIESVDDERADRNGWWVHLKRGWIHGDFRHVIHGDTLSDCAAQLEHVGPCGCSWCAGSLNVVEGRRKPGPKPKSPDGLPRVPVLLKLPRPTAALLRELAEERGQSQADIVVAALKRVRRQS